MRHTVAAVAVALVMAACSHGHADLRKPSTQDDFGVQMAKMNLWREALFRFQRAVQLNPNDAMAHNNLAVAYEANGEYENAAKEYREALKLDRSNQYIQKNYSRYTEFMARNKKRQLRQEGKIATEGKPAAATGAATAAPTTATSTPSTTSPATTTAPEAPAGGSVPAAKNPGDSSAAPPSQPAPSTTSGTTASGTPPQSEPAPNAPAANPPAQTQNPPAQNPPAQKPPDSSAPAQNANPPNPPAQTPPPSNPPAQPSNPPGGSR